MTGTIEYDISGLTPYIDWRYFFHTWGFPARFAAVGNVHDCPACLAAWCASFGNGDSAQAHEAARLYKDAANLLARFNGKYKVRARFGLYPAASEGDDVWVEVPVKDNDRPVAQTEDTPETDRTARPSADMQDRETEKHHGAKQPEDSTKQPEDGATSVRLPFLRQQRARPGAPCLCLADFIAPRGKAPADDFRTVASTIGIFVTAVDGLMERHHSDDYERMLVQTLCDRLAEAAAERMHEAIRREHWGYACDERLTSEELFAEKYAGRRPAVGYPSLPDQSILFVLDRLLDFGQIGVSLTENGMMRPHAAVAGLLFGHPATRHFSVGPIDEEQLEDYSRRRGLGRDVLAKFLAGNLHMSAASPQT